MYMELKTDKLPVPEHLPMNWLPTGAVSKQYKMILSKMARTSITVYYKLWRLFRGLNHQLQIVTMLLLS